MGFTEWIKSLFEPAWYQKDEWAKVNTEIGHVVVEEHDCPSWDIEVYWVKTYRHKDRCDKRLRLSMHKDLGETHTTFTDPTNREIEWTGFSGKFTSRYISEDELYNE